MALSVRLDTPLPAFALRIDEHVSGGVLALVGPSGAGKTTVLEIIAGLRRPRAGSVISDGVVWLDTASAVELAPQRRRVGYVFQDLALFPNLSARDNVAWGIPLPRDERRRRAMELLERFGAGHTARRRARELSGGERRRVALARALGSDPRVLLLDEPLEGLDAESRRTAITELRIAADAIHGPTIIVTHDLADAAELADRVVVLDRGRIVQRGSPRELGASPSSPFVARLVGANTLRGRARPAGGGLTAIRLAGGAEILSAHPAKGDVVASVFPSDIRLARVRPDEPRLNAISAGVEAVSTLGPRTKVRLALPEAMVAEVDTAAADRLGLERGDAVVALWDPAATVVVAG
jgi:ABC-type sulfate/molybdate transport systems ATPase subunit